MSSSSPIKQYLVTIFHLHNIATGNILSQSVAEKQVHVVVIKSLDWNYFVVKILKTLQLNAVIG